MKTFAITERAKQQIDDYLSARPSLVFGIFWSGKNYIEGEWVIGYYDRRKVSNRDAFITICGLEIISDPLDRPFLEGKTIDYVGEKFVLAKLHT